MKVIIQRSFSPHYPWHVPGGVVNYMVYAIMRSLRELLNGERQHLD